MGILARVHWLGLQQISADTNSAHFMSVWQLPQTAALAAQTLGKISRLPGGGATNAASALLRPLLDDFISAEFYLEILARTNSEPATLNPQFVLALRLPADRARLWQTNLAAALQVLNGVRPVATSDGWLLQPTNATGSIEFSRDREWTLVGIGADKKTLQSEFAACLARPPAPPAANCWLEADLDVPRLAALGSSLLTLVTRHSSLNHLHLAAFGEAGNVRTRATADFSRPLDRPLPSWEIPTNLIHAPLTSFTIVRGVAPWLATLTAWQKLRLNPPPDQAVCWSLAGIPFQTYLAAPLPAASNQLAQLASRLVADANPWLATNAAGSLSWSGDPPGILWNNANLLTPFLFCATFDRHEYLLGGLYPPAGGLPTPPPAGILDSIIKRPDLLFSSVEQTGIRVEDGLFISQLFRVVFHRAQLPPNAAGTRWLKNIEPLLGESISVISRDNPGQMILERESTIGFTALELHVLADWLESPQFPNGLHTLLVPPEY